MNRYEQSIINSTNQISAARLQRTLLETRPNVTMGKRPENHKAFARTMSKANDLLFSNKLKLKYYFWIILLGIGTYIILRYFRDDMGLMVKIATILSFLTAPFYAILNFILITGKHTPKEYQPSIYLKVLSICGIIFLIGFSAWFLLSL